MKVKLFKRLLFFSALGLSILLAVPRVQRAGQPNAFDSIKAAGQTRSMSPEFGIVRLDLRVIGPEWRLNLRIEQPNVKQHITNYPGVEFEPGDRVTISGGGCVQTGGGGNTWKRYVDPQGPNSDRLYHGLVWVPGAVEYTKGAFHGPLRIVDAKDKTFVVPERASRDLHLRVGYEDDDYSDNGYWGHDDGTGDQCKGVGSAFVSITISRRLPAGVAEINGGLRSSRGQLIQDKDGQVSIQTGPYPNEYADFKCLHATPVLCDLFIEYNFSTGYLLGCRESGNSKKIDYATCVWEPTNLHR